ncbi:MAG: hypothetical protein E7574_02735 [Ruminococcaceae bacterium]|nr:hypothetical protein [Oscillospiraceae bacterium]
MRKLSFVLAVLLMCTVIFTGCASKEEKIYDYDLKEYITVGTFPKVKLDEEALQKAIDDAVKSIAEKNKVTTDVTDRAVAKGDTVNIDYVGKIDGKEFTGGSAKGTNLTIGSNKFIAGFEDGLIGWNIGDEKDLNLVFPEDYSNKDIAGKDVVFTVKINSIKTETIPELTDKMIEDLKTDDYKTVAEFLKVHRKENVEDLLWKGFLDSCKVTKYPEKETKELYNKTIETYKAMAINYYGTTLQNLVTGYGYKTLDDFFAETLANSRDTVKEEMAVYYIVREHKIEISDEDYKTLGLEMAKENNYKTLEEYENYVGVEAIKYNIYKDKIVEMAVKANAIDFDSPVETSAADKKQDVTTAA